MVGEYRKDPEWQKARDQLVEEHFENGKTADEAFILRMHAIAEMVRIEKKYEEA